MTRLPLFGTKIRVAGFAGLRLGEQPAQATTAVGVTALPAAVAPERRPARRCCVVLRSDEPQQPCEVQIRADSPAPSQSRRAPSLAGREVSPWRA
jgi:hypothetical protein